MNFYRHSLGIPLNERRHSIGPAQSVSTIRPFLAQQEKKPISSTPRSFISFSSINIRAFSFQCCGERRNSSQKKTVEQTSTTNSTRRKSSTPSVSSHRPSKTLIRNYRKTNTKSTIIPSSITNPTSTKSIKNPRRRGGMASACTSCISSNHSRRQSSTTIEDITTTPTISSSTNPPLLTRLGQIILRRKITGGANNRSSSNVTVNNKSR
ncbi:unnamed protein product [Rotaria sordida]|nr:unnamed protein product [Rotaria sordida]